MAPSRALIALLLSVRAFNCVTSADNAIKQIPEHNDHNVITTSSSAYTSASSHSVFISDSSSYLDLGSHCVWLAHGRSPGWEQHCLKIMAIGAYKYDDKR